MPTTCSQCEAPLLPAGAAAFGLDNPDGSPFVFAELATLNDLNDLKTLANQVTEHLPVQTLQFVRKITQCPPKYGPTHL
jgi:hypothetical protein